METAAELELRPIFRLGLEASETNVHGSSSPFCSSSWIHRLRLFSRSSLNAWTGCAKIVVVPVPRSGGSKCCFSRVASKERTAPSHSRRLHRFQSALNGALQSRYTYLKPWILIMKYVASSSRNGWWIVDRLSSSDCAHCTVEQTVVFQHFVSGGKS